MLLSTIFTCFVCIRTAISIPTSKSESELIFPQGPYTLTLYNPSVPMDNGLKVENFGLTLKLFTLGETTQYCPFAGTNQSSLCPNGTETVFTHAMQPLSQVPGGQDLFVEADGRISITPQHSHLTPLGAFSQGIGWTWTPLPDQQKLLEDCPPKDADARNYNCITPTGYFTFKAPNATHGGLRMCVGFDQGATIIGLYAVTPLFNRWMSTEFTGFATHPTSGDTALVWAYD